MKKIKDLKKKIIVILKNNGYSVSYESYFSKEELRKHAKNEPNMKEDLFFTVKNNKKHVIARLVGIGEKDEIDKNNFEKLLNYFSIYEIPNRDAIFEELSKFE